METLIKTLPPKPPNDKKTLAGFPDDFIRELGDKIAQLTTEEAAELSSYIEDKK